MSRWKLNPMKIGASCLTCAMLLCVIQSSRATNAPPANPPRSASQLVSVTIASDQDQIVPSQTFHLAVVFTIKPHWHIYWMNPGMSGIPTTIEVKAPEGYLVGETKFTRPISIGTWDGPDGLTYGYENNVVLFVPITPPENLDDGEATFEADITYLVCKEKCLFGDEHRTISLPTRSDANTIVKPVDPMVSDAMNRLPLPLRSQDGAKLDLRHGQLTISMPSGPAKAATFFPIERPGITFGQPSIRIENGTLFVLVEVDVNPSNSIEGDLSVSGVLALGTSRDDPCYSFDVPPADP